jgi:hypothetical protein
LTPAWGDEATINILFAEFHQGAAEPSWICSEFSVQQPGGSQDRAMRCHEINPIFAQYYCTVYISHTIRDR